MIDTKSDKLKQQAIALAVCSMYLLANERASESLVDKFMRLAEYKDQIRSFVEESNSGTSDQWFAEWLENMLDEALEGGND